MCWYSLIRVKHIRNLIDHNCLTFIIFRIDFKILSLLGLKLSQTSVLTKLDELICIHLIHSINDKLKNCKDFDFRIVWHGVTTTFIGNTLHLKSFSDFVNIALKLVRIIFCWTKIFYKSFSLFLRINVCLEYRWLLVRDSCNESSVMKVYAHARYFITF